MQDNQSNSSPQIEPALILHFGRWPVQILLGTLLLVSLLLFRLPALKLFTTHFLGGYLGDSGLYLWLMQQHAAHPGGSPWFELNMFYPYSRVLAWSDNFILPGLIGAPFIRVGVPLVIVWNGLMLFVQFLNGWCSFRVAFLISGSVSSAFLAGISFMLLSVLSFNLGHPQLQFAFFLPLAISLTLRALQRPALHRGMFLGLAVSAAFLCCVYYSLFMVLIAATLGLAILLQSPKLISLREYIHSGIGLLFGLAFILPFVFPYLDVKNTFNPRGIFEAYYFSADVLSYFSSNPLNFLYAPLAQFSHAEAYLFPGSIILIAALFGIVGLCAKLPHRGHAGILIILFLLTALFSLKSAWAPLVSVRYSLILCALSSWGFLLVSAGYLYRQGYGLNSSSTKLDHKAITLALIFCTLFFFTLSLGPLGNPVKGYPAFGLFRVMYELVPGFDALRAIGRVGLVSLLFLILLASLTLASLFRSSRLISILGTLLCAGLICLEQYQVAIPLDQRLAMPDIFRTLAEIPSSKDAVVILPVTNTIGKNGEIVSEKDYATTNVDYMQWTATSQRPMVNGYSGQRSKLINELARDTRNFPDERSLTTLNSIAGLRYVLFNSSEPSEINRTDFLKRLSKFSSQLELVSQDQNSWYFLKLISEQELSKAKPILVPSFPQGFLSIEFKANKADSSLPAKVDIFIENHYEENPIFTAEVQKNGEYASFNLILPPTSDRVRPLRVFFKSQDGTKVWFRRTSFQSFE